MKTSRIVSRTALVLALGLGLAAPMGASAQKTSDRSAEARGRHAEGCGHGKRGFHGGKHRMFADLDLTENQKAQMKAIRESARERAREIRSQGRSDATRTQLMELRKETHGLMMEVLTPAQRQKVEARKEEWKKRWEERRGTKGKRA